MSNINETIRNVAYGAVYLLPHATERHDPLRPAPLMEDVHPSEQHRVYQIAARRLSLQLLYELDVQNPGDPEALLERTLDSVEDLGPIARSGIGALALGAYHARTAADAEFKALAPDWPPHRQAAVDRAILRLGHYELSQGITPASVVINEAVELAKHFSTDRSPPFVNGLLDKVAKRLAAEHAAKPAEGEKP